MKQRLLGRIWQKRKINLTQRRNPVKKVVIVKHLSVCLTLEIRCTFMSLL